MVHTGRRQDKVSGQPSAKLKSAVNMLSMKDYCD